MFRAAAELISAILWLIYKSLESLTLEWTLFVYLVKVISMKGVSVMEVMYLEEVAKWKERLKKNKRRAPSSLNRPCFNLDQSIFICVTPIHNKSHPMTHIKPV